jgi:hypothetical protein
MNNKNVGDSIKFNNNSNNNNNININNNKSNSNNNNNNTISLSMDSQSNYMPVTVSPTNIKTDRPVSPKLSTPTK